MAISIGAAGAVGSGLLNAVIAELIANKLGGALGQGVAGAVTPTPSSGRSADSKFMITLNDAKEAELVFDNLNFRRRIAGLDPIDPATFIRRREEALRESARQAGGRERMIRQIDSAARGQEALATLAGTRATAASNLGSNIANTYLAQANIDPALAEAARAF
jgi:hypothetical protein